MKRSTEKPSANALGTGSRELIHRPAHTLLCRDHSPARSLGDRPLGGV